VVGGHAPVRRGFLVDQWLQGGEGLRVAALHEIDDSLVVGQGGSECRRNVAGGSQGVQEFLGLGPLRTSHCKMDGIERPLRRVGVQGVGSRQIAFSAVEVAF